MRPTQHPSNNRVLGAPVGWDQQQLPCNALPITDAQTDGQPAIVSFWQPTAAELAALVAGKPVMLWVFGRSMPPVALGIDGVEEG